jgi:predicted AAA+ superfamily ATPase
MNGLLKNFKASDDRKGLLFENLIYNQLLASAKNQDKDIDIKYFRTHDGTEVDFVVNFNEHQYLIEVKATDNVGHGDLKSLIALKDSVGHEHSTCFVFTINSSHKKINGIEIIPWQLGLKKMGL